MSSASIAFSAVAPGTTGHWRCTGRAGSLFDHVSTVQPGGAGLAVGDGAGATVACVEASMVGDGAGPPGGVGAHPDSARPSAHAPASARRRLTAA